MLQLHCGTKKKKQCQKPGEKKNERCKQILSHVFVFDTLIYVIAVFFLHAFEWIFFFYSCNSITLFDCYDNSQVLCGWSLSSAIWLFVFVISGCHNFTAVLFLSYSQLVRRENCFSHGNITTRNNNNNNNKYEQPNSYGSLERVSSSLINHCGN